MLGPNIVTLEKRGVRTIARCRYEDRAVPKAAGFRWDPSKREWFTTDPATAAKLADPVEAEKLKAAALAREGERAAAVEASRAADSDAVLPVPPGLAYLPYQRAGIASAVKRPSVLFGDEMGLGKTIQAIGIINADESIKRVLVICPASLRLNWARELKKWLVRPMVAVLANTEFWNSRAAITIINYDILTQNRADMAATDWDLIICDEAHMLKNPKAKRTEAVVGRYVRGKCEVQPLKARRRVMMTGTPIPNRPIEGWPIFHYLDPVEFPSFFAYARRYAGATETNFGWDFTGASNLGELQERLRASIMIRRLKSEVLTELPPKRRNIIEIPSESAAVREELEAWDARQGRLVELREQAEAAKDSNDRDRYAAAVAALREATGAAFAEIAALRRDTAVEKIPYVIEHLQNALESEDKLVVFAHHHAVLDALAAEFGRDAVSVHGQTPMAARQPAVDRFQTDPSCRVFIGGIQAAGVGLTLTAASHVVFAELDWVPGVVTQCEDRCHRIGQQDSVLVEHLVLEGSLDARMAQILVQKQEVISKALDDKSVPIVPEVRKERAAPVPDVVKETEAAWISAERGRAIHAALRVIAGMDGDRARELNGRGFSRIDGAFGHDLAGRDCLTERQVVAGLKLVNKYRRQIPAELLADCGIEAKS